MARTASVILLSLVALGACETDNPVASTYKVSTRSIQPHVCCGYAVTVTPKGTNVADSSTWKLAYTVKNTGTVTTTYDLLCTTQGFAGCDSINGSGVVPPGSYPQYTITLIAGAERQVYGYFHRFGQCYKRMTLTANGPSGGTVEASDEGYYQSNPCFISSVSGPRQLQPGNTCNYTASASGGTPPYTFTWSWTTDGSASVGGYSPSNGNFILAGQGGQGNVYLTATATDANGLAASGSETIWLNPNISC